MPRADQATIDMLTDYFQAMEVKDFDRLGAYYADNITQTFANAPTITGRDTADRAAGRRHRGRDPRGHRRVADAVATDPVRRLPHRLPRCPPGPRRPRQDRDRHRRRRRRTLRRPGQQRARRRDDHPDGPARVPHQPRPEIRRHPRRRRARRRGRHQGHRDHPAKARTWSWKPSATCPPTSGRTASSAPAG